MQEFFDPTQNPVGFALPFFVLSIALELAALRWLDHDDNVTGYALQDARTSILMGAGSLVSSLVLKLAIFGLLVWLYDNAALWHLPSDAWWSWLVAIVAIDFAYYWQHRFVHRARVGWAAHQAHHSSEYMNFGTALRQKWNPWLDVFFWLPLPVLGLAPAAMYVAFGINLVYQFFVHTEMVQTLPRPVELVLNTPSHHRVHHGSDPIYLDRNYAGILIVWDRMFGTFQPELHQPKYGLTKPVGTYHLLKLQYGDYADLWRDLRAASCWRDRLGYLFRPPGWQPEARAGEVS